MKKPIYFITILLGVTICAYSQSDCEASFASGDVYRWRGQLNFIPKTMTIERLNYIINYLSDAAYNQMHIEIKVDCRDIQVKNGLIQNMKYKWDNKISETTLATYFPAYYVFYQLDKSDKGSSANYPSEQKIKSANSEPAPHENNESPSIELTDLYLFHIFNKDVIKKNPIEIGKIFFDKPMRMIRDPKGHKFLYWEEKGLNVLFKFNGQGQCIYINILPLSHQTREKISNYLSSNFIHLSSVKWYSKPFAYYVQLILDDQDHFVCFKDLGDLKGD